MVSFSDAAVEKLSELLAQRENEAECLRIYVKPGGCTGFSYGMALDLPTANDLILDMQGLQVALERESLELIEGSQVDYLDDFSGQGFQIFNPNATATCGCGSSFRTKEQAGQPGSCE